jgi:hypothetical protein
MFALSAHVDGSPRSVAPAALQCQTYLLTHSLSLSFTHTHTLGARADALSVGGGRWLQALYTTHAKHPCFVKPRVGKAAFGLRHFAGEVEYAVDGCLVKNQNRLAHDCTALMRTSALPLVAQLFADAAAPSVRPDRSPIMRAEPVAMDSPWADHWAT